MPRRAARRGAARRRAPRGALSHLAGAAAEIVEHGAGGRGRAAQDRDERAELDLAVRQALAVLDRVGAVGARGVRGRRRRRRRHVAIALRDGRAVEPIEQRAEGLVRPPQLGRETVDLAHLRARPRVALKG